MRIFSVLFLCCLAFNFAHAETPSCETAVLGGDGVAATPVVESKVRSWDLGSGYSFERNDQLYYINTPDGPVNLPAGHYANFHNLTAITRQPEAKPGHPAGFIVIAVNDGRLSHLISLDAVKGEKYRHRLLDGKVTSITALPDSMLLMRVDSPEDVWVEDRGVRLELIDSNIHSVHAKVVIGKAASEPIVEDLMGVTLVHVKTGLHDQDDWVVVRHPNGKYRLDPF